MEETVILYSTGCPKCSLLERKLKEKNVSFLIKNDINEMESLGISEAPVLKLKDELKNFSESLQWILKK